MKGGKTTTKFRFMHDCLGGRQERDRSWTYRYIKNDKTEEDWQARERYFAALDEMHRKYFAEYWEKVKNENHKKEKNANEFELESKF